MKTELSASHCTLCLTNIPPCIRVQLADLLMVWQTCMWSSRMFVHTHSANGMQCMPSCAALRCMRVCMHARTVFACCAAEPCRWERPDAPAETVYSVRWQLTEGLCHYTADELQGYLQDAFLDSVEDVPFEVRAAATAPCAASHFDHLFMPLVASASALVFHAVSTCRGLNSVLQQLFSLLRFALCASFHATWPCT